MATNPAEPDACEADPPGPSMTPELLALRDRVVADVARYAATLLPGRLLTQDAYFFASGWRFPVKTIKKLGGWLAVCRAAGLRAEKPEKCNSLAMSRKELRREIVHDIKRIAAKIGLGQNDDLPLRRYREEGGFYCAAIRHFRWSALCRQAGLFAGNGRPGPKRDREPQTPPDKPVPPQTWAQFDAALDELLGYTKVPRGPLTLGHCRGQWRKRPAPPPVERGELIADLRDVSMRLGLLTPRLLTWETYHRHGGQYRFDDFVQLGGFDKLRRAA